MFYLFEPDTVYAATLSGLYKTTDAARSWKRIGESLQDQMIISMALNRRKKISSIWWAATGAPQQGRWGTWASLNNGLTTTNVRTIAQSPMDPKLFYAGTNGSGLYRSDDAGETWMPMPVIKEANK